MSYQLIDNEVLNQYEFQIEAYTPKIEYIKNKQQQIFLTHTEVPRALEGKGIGAALVKATLEDVKEKELSLVPLCPFVAAYIKRHPEWKSILSRGINI